MYGYTTVTGTINDDLILTSTSFFLLALAGLEFCVGFLIIVFYRNFKKTFDLDNYNTTTTRKTPKNISINRYVWLYTDNT